MFPFCLTDIVVETLSPLHHGADNNVCTTVITIALDKRVVVGIIHAKGTRLREHTTQNSPLLRRMLLFLNSLLLIILLGIRRVAYSTAWQQDDLGQERTTTLWIDD